MTLPLEEPKNTSGNPSWWDKLVSPAEMLTDAQIDILLSIPQVQFSPYIKNKFKFFIKKNWKTRSGKKSALTLARELDHVCAREYLTKLKDGDSTHIGFDKEIQEKLDMLNDPSNDNDTKLSIQGAIDIKIEQISKLYTDGPFTVFKDNLVFNEKGIPIGARGSDEQKRFRQCHEKLSEDDFARQRVPVGPDVTSNPYKKAGTRRRKKTRKTKRRSRR